jgi:TonB family protein
MLHPFISAAPARALSAPLLALSASVHVGFICAAVWSTGALRPTQLTERATERVQFAELPISTARRTTTRPPSRLAQKARVDVERAFDLPLVPVSFDLALPELEPLPGYQPDDTDLEIGEKVDLAYDVLHLGIRPSASSSPLATRHHAYDESIVDRVAKADPANPKPRYPSRMQARGIETRFIVYFVVDTTGVIDTTTVELPAAVEKEFVAAVSEVMVRWHFVPAELAGRPVRQMVMQPFVFQMGALYSSMGRR